MEVTINRVVDNQDQKFIAIFVKGRGRIVLLEGDDYPKNNLVGMSKKKFDEIVEAKLAE